MTNQRPEHVRFENGDLDLRSLAKRTLRALVYRWPWKMACLAMAVVIWGSIISQDGTLTRDKTFTDVPINIVNREALLRGGLIVTNGLDQLPALKMKADVPQRVYNTLLPSAFNVRLDLSRITQQGEQKVPIQYSNSAASGTITWMSEDTVTLQVEEYRTRSRIPVQVEVLSAPPPGFYAQRTQIDPPVVSVSGPRAIVEKIQRCVAKFDQSILAARPGQQLSAVPYVLVDSAANAIDAKLLTVTNGSTAVESILIEQELYPMKAVDINLTGITTGKPAAGYRVSAVTADPAYLSIAGSHELIQSLKLLDVESPINIEGMSDTLIRSLRILTPPRAVWMSDETVYVTVEITPAAAQETTP